MSGNFTVSSLTDLQSIVNTLGSSCDDLGFQFFDCNRTRHLSDRTVD